METRWRLLLEARYIISLNKQINDLIPIIKVDKETIYNDINYRLKKFDLELYQRVISVLNKNY